MASLTQWTWVWVDSRSWWWTGRPGVLWFMGLQRVRHDWATELNWITLLRNFFDVFYRSFPHICHYSKCFFLFSSHSLLSLGLQFHMYVAAWSFTSAHWYSVHFKYLSDSFFLCFVLIVSIDMALTLLTSASVASSLLWIASCTLLCELSTLHFSDSHLCVLNSGSWSLPMI